MSAPASVRDARIRDLKRALKGFGWQLEEARIYTKSAQTIGYYGKFDRKVKAFRRYERMKHAYRNVKDQHDAIAAELRMLQDQARRAQAKGGAR